MHQLFLSISSTSPSLSPPSLTTPPQPPPPHTSSDTLLAHPPPPHTLHHFITIPPCHRSISLSAGLSLSHIVLLLYLTASTFPCFPYRTISVHDLLHPLSRSLSLLNYLFLSHVKTENHGKKWESRKGGWIDKMMDK